MPTPALHSLYVRPVKSLGGPSPVEAAVEPWGLAGDRRWMLIDTTAKVVTQRQLPRLALAFAEQLPDGGVRLSAPGMEPLSVAVPEPSVTIAAEIFRSKVEAVPAGAAADAWFTAHLGHDVRLVHLDDPARRRPINPKYARPGETVNFADGYPLLVTTVSSLDALNSLIAEGDHPEEGPLPMDRFRPTVVVEGTAPWDEDRWTRLAIGGVTFRVAKPCARCVVTTTDQTTARRGKEPLRTLARHRLIGKKMIFGQNLIPEHTGTLRVGDPVEILG
ncbi:molybdenum cofactor biosysynthesis protein [Streptomyces sp. CB03234]|uniref:MOSC domain-containing protein n=1 Tax=Streptomyces sp. (strain CB03234) TaxID=1703937 RepID=UPI00093D1C66|nr:MOSC N-terminal beta barrel domain-containing protein [Streptomyces sp. CB03234]OKK03425.1 molybdenum cofactor biosysynthesis protein [Streptomyces sp. CB03234]